MPSSVETTQEQHPLSAFIAPLTLADRCDKCGAQAWYAVLVNVSSQYPLLFCKHHADEIELKIIEMNPFATLDNRSEINNVD